MGRLARFVIPEIPHHVTQHANQPATLTGAGAASYIYDGNFKRMKETRGGKTIYNIYSRVTGGLIYRDEVTDAIKTDYVNAGGAAIRLIKVGTGSAVPDYSHFDADDFRLSAFALGGSVVADIRTLGQVLWRESYEPFGRTRINPAANDNDTGYTGHLKDKDSGLQYMQARYYDPLIGRFYSTDPIGYQDQLNLYAYVANDPVNKTDPTGEFLNILIGGIGGAVVGAAIDAGLQAAGDISRGEAISIDKGQVLAAAAVGAATGAVGPAGGTALRAALVGKAAASAKAASPALRAVTDTAADVAGQAAIGAVASAASGEDPGIGATSGVATSGINTAAEALTVGRETTSKSAVARGGVASFARKAATEFVKGVASEAAAKGVERQIEQDRKD